MKKPFAPRDMQTELQMVVRQRRVGGGLSREGCVGNVGACSLARGRGSGWFMRPLTFTSPAFQSAVSIKDGCSSYVFPIHQRPRDTGAPVTDSST